MILSRLSLHQASTRFVWNWYPSSQLRPLDCHYQCSSRQRFKNHRLENGQSSIFMCACFPSRSPASRPVSTNWPTSLISSLHLQFRPSASPTEEKQAAISYSPNLYFTWPEAFEGYQTTFMEILASAQADGLKSPTVKASLSRLHESLTPFGTLSLNSSYCGRLLCSSCVAIKTVNQF